MPEKCCAHNCSQQRDKEQGIHLYRIPKDPDRRQKFIRAINRAAFDPVTGGPSKDGKPWEPTDNDRLCSKHFAGGE